MNQSDVQKHYKFNFTVGVLDGAFFGLALGFASYVTILPLFVSKLTDSTILIGLIATIHLLGWQLPQLLTSNRVAGLRRIRPMVIMMTFHERVPFFGLAIVAFLLPHMSNSLALFLTLVMLVWQSIGGGFTGTPWQSMISKVIPIERRGFFYGVQSTFANLMSSGGAVVAGLVLGAVIFPNNFALIFFLAGISMIISMIFLMFTRETETPLKEEPNSISLRELWQKSRFLLGSNPNFVWFLIARSTTQFAVMAIAFYTIYAVRTFNMSPEVAGALTGVMFISQTFSSIVTGWLGDRFGHRMILAGGNLLMAIAALLILIAPSLSWFYVIFAITGIVNSTQWTAILAISAEFGTESERPFYIGMANSFIAPTTLFAPLIGGWLADFVGFQATFGVSIFFGILTVFILMFIMHDPLERKQKLGVTVGD